LDSRSFSGNSNMTLLYASGFENVRDDTDFRAQGWFVPTAAAPRGWVAGIGVSSAQVAAGSGQLGTGALAMLATPNTTGVYTNSATAPGGAVINYGWRPLGLTWQQLWTAGGAAVGHLMKFNQASVSARGNFFGQGTYTFSLQSVTDGTRFFCLANNGGVFTFQYTTDGVNWTTLPNPPGVTFNAQSVIFWMGSGTLAVAQALSPNFYTTTNLGTTWTTSTIPASTPTSFYARSGQIIVGNGTATVIIFAATSVSSGADAGVWIGNLGGTFTKFENFATNAYSPNGVEVYGTLLVHNELRISPITGTYCVFYPTNLSATSTTSQISGTIGTVYRAVYSATLNKWVAMTSLGSGGLYTGANTGTISQPIMPANLAWTLASGLTGTGYALAFDGNSTFVASTSTGIYWSTDAVTWTKAVTSISSYDTAVAQLEYVNGTWFATTNASPFGGTGTTNTAGSGSTLVSPDGKLWTLASFPEALETTANAQATGFFSASAINTTTGTYTNPATAGSAIAMLPGAIASGSRNIGNFTYATAVTLGSVVNNVNGGWRFMGWELTPTTTNLQFSCQVFIDGSPLGAAFLVTVPTGTNQVIFQLPLGGQWTQMDDLIIILKDGTYPNTNIGIAAITSNLPATDTQAQWTKSGSAVSNSLTLASPSPYLSPSNFLTSTTAGTKDVYGMANSIPTAQKIKAVFAEVNLTATATATVSLGVVSGSAETDAAAQTIATGAAQTIQAVFPTDPNTGQPWTNAAALAAKLALIQVS
jgi:hypothetical protein